MLSAGEYADILRAVGWMLDQQPAPERVDIAVRGAALEVRWSGASGAGRRLYGSDDVGALRERAHALRAGGGTNSPDAYAERLLTIGQELDDEGILLERLLVLPTGYRTMGTLGWYSLAHWYSPETVRAMSEERRALRKTPLESRVDGVAV